jgi:hypothetical protein
MDVEQNRASMGPRLFWRRLVGTALIYALIMQPLLLAIVGAQLANATAIDDLYPNSASMPLTVPPSRPTTSISILRMTIVIFVLPEHFTSWMRHAR